MIHFRRQVLQLVASAVLGAFWASSAQAQVWPAAKPIRLVVPFGAGGSSDAAGRLIANELQILLGQSVVVDNKAGAAGMIGTDLVAKAPADGYTLALVDIFHTTAPIFFRKMPYDAVKDFTPVALIGKTPAYLFANPNFAAKTAAEVIAMGRKEPGKANMAMIGTGSVVVELFKARGGVQFTNVPYPGSSRAVLDLMGGQVDIMITTMASAGTQLKGGKIKVLATTAAKRHPDFPDVPTFAELGIGGMDYEQWFGIVAPAGTPKGIVDQLNVAVNKAMATPNARERLAGLVMDAAPGTPEDFKRRLEGDAQRWVRLAAEVGIKPLD